MSPASPEFERILAEAFGPDWRSRVDRLLARLAPEWAGVAVKAVRPDGTRESIDLLAREPEPSG